MQPIINYKKRLVNKDSTILEALAVLNEIAQEPIAFIVDDYHTLLGSLTDGDIRRGLLKGLVLSDKVHEIIQPNPVFIRKDSYDIKDIVEYKRRNIMVIPVVDQQNKIINIISMRQLRSYLPIDVVIMAGGKGERLMPLTENTPKPMLKVGESPILEHNIKRLQQYGVDDFWISINYKGDIIREYFGNGMESNVNIDYVTEDQPLGTIGSVSKIIDFKHDHVLIMNSDILTNIDFEHFFLDFVEEHADLSVVSIPYKVSVPYAVLENNERSITGFSEKPTYTYYSNGGIYLIKKQLIIDNIPKNTFFNATDLIEKLVEQGKKVISYHLSGYWLDIGKHEDYIKAQEDIKSIRF
jgi:dTDP-glucose pyrophosphorylase